MHDIFKSERFQKELAEYNSIVAKLHQPDHKRSVQNLIDQLISEAKLINEGHASNNDGKISPKNLRDNISKMADIRSQLKTLSKNL